MWHTRTLPCSAHSLQQTPQINRQTGEKCNVYDRRSGSRRSWKRLRRIDERFSQPKLLFAIAVTSAEDTNINGIREAYHGSLSLFIKEYLPHMVQEHNIINHIIFNPPVQCDWNLDSIGTYFLATHKAVGELWGRAGQVRWPGKLDCGTVGIWSSSHTPSSTPQPYRYIVWIKMQKDGRSLWWTLSGAKLLRLILIYCLKLEWRER